MRPNAFIAREAVIDRFVHRWIYKQPTACLWGIIGLDEPLSDQLIEKAVKILITIVPILSARLKKGLWCGHWEFVKPGNIKALISRKKAFDQKDADLLLKEIIKNPIDPENPPSIRITSIDLPDDHYLILQVHHIIMDGEGSKELFDLFAEIYRKLEKDPQWQPDNFPVMDRSWFQIAKHLKWYKFLIAPIIAFKEFGLVIHTILKLRKTASVIIGDFPDKSKNTIPEDPKVETFVVHDHEIDLIKARLKKEGAKVNDLIMAALMTTVNAWNSTHGETFSYVLSGYTVNLRRWWGRPTGTFANMSTICFVISETENLIDVHKAIKALKPKFDKAKKEFGLKELWDLLILKIQPELISRIFSFLFVSVIKKTHAMTNIGIIPESAGDFGRIKATSYSLIAPPLPGPHLLYTATSYKDNLTIHCNFDGIHIKQKTVKNLMHQFKNNILEFVLV